MWEVLICRPELTRYGRLLAEWGHEMPDDLPSTSTNRELAVKVVSAYLRRNQVGADQIGGVISTIYAAFGQLGTPAREPFVEQSPAVSIRRSITPTSVICLDCGYRGQMLRRHLTTAHELTAEAYRARWNLPRDHALTAPSYSERRSTMAKQLGLGRGRSASNETTVVPETEASTRPSPRRRGRPRSAAVAT
jgi:predicted transcriptional regulator